MEQELLDFGLHTGSLITFLSFHSTLCANLMDLDGFDRSDGVLGHDIHCNTMFVQLEQPRIMHFRQQRIPKP